MVTRGFALACWCLVLTSAAESSAWGDRPARALLMTMWRNTRDLQPLSYEPRETGLRRTRSIAARPASPLHG